MKKEINEEKRYMDVAKEMNLFFNDPQSAGVVFWKPNGLKLYENLRAFIRDQHQRRGYQEVKSPSIVSPLLFDRSGHMSKYKENMFFLNNSQDAEYALRPMSCPNHILIYNSEMRSYKDLPFAAFEFGEVYRNESSGSLQVLFRQRQFCQDDSHVFSSEDKVIDSLNKFIQMSKEVYEKIGFKKMEFAISLRPEKRFGSDELWDKAENSLREACKINNIDYREIPNDGAFYGPKLEIQVRDQLDRAWQLGVVQLDYVLPERFDLSFINEKNEKERPVILHHAVVGSLERMIGIVLESFGKSMPEFLHPVRHVVIPVSEKYQSYARKVSDHIGAEVDISSDSLSKKIRSWKIKGIPNIYVVGEKEFVNYQENNVMSAFYNGKLLIIK